MKKYAKLITAILLVSLLAISLFACADPGNDTQGTMTLVLLDGDVAQEYYVDLSKVPSGNSSSGLMAILDYLQSEGRLTYTAQEYGYGAYLTQVGELQEGEGKYIYIYTDVEADFDVTQYAVQITYKGKSYTNSGVNASQMTVKANCTIVITYITFD